jgi:hypothetical protein
MPMSIRDFKEVNVLMRAFRSLLVALIAVPFLLGHYCFAAQATTPDSSVDTVKVKVPDQVVTIFKANCATAGCHRGNHPKKDMSLEPDKFLSSTLDVASQENKNLKRVDTTDPEKSYLLMKIRGDKGIKGSRMPDEEPPLKKEDIKAIQDWIYCLRKSPAKDTEEKPAPPPESKKKVQGMINERENPAFWANRLINLPTTKTIGKGEVLLRVSHRFYAPTKKGYDFYYGPDVGAFVLLSLGYGITDNLDVTLGHSNLYHEFELSLDWRVLNQGAGWGHPVSLVFSGGGSLISQKPENKKVFRSENFKINMQASLSRQVINSLSFLLVPAYSSNTNRYPYHSEPAEGTWVLGTGGRFTPVVDFSIIAEWTPVLSGYEANSRGWGSGVEYKTGGHVFQVFVTNCFGLTSDQFFPGGDLKLSHSEFRLGFNIFRTF